MVEIMKEAKINCPHCYKIIELEQDQENNIFVVEENEIDTDAWYDWNK